MADFRKMSVKALRELARTAIGRGHSTFKTKRDLIHALQAAERKVASAAERAAARVKEGAERRAARAEAKPAEPTRTRPAAKAAARPPASPVGRKEAGPPAGRAGGKRFPATRPARGESEGPGPEPSSPPRGAREPDPEGYVVSRVAGEEAAREAPRPLAEGATAPIPEAPSAAPPAFSEELGELPSSYPGDALIALPRDPATLFLFWEHDPRRLEEAAAELGAARPQLWIFAQEGDGGWRKVRELDVALAARSHYVHDLEPGWVYRAEIHAVGQAGAVRLCASNEIPLPPYGPSPVRDDRFMRVAWSEPLQRLPGEAHPGEPFPEEVREQLARLSDWSRFPGRVWGGAPGGRPGPLSGAPHGEGAAPVAGAGQAPTSAGAPPGARLYGPSSPAGAPWSAAEGPSSPATPYGQPGRPSSPSGPWGAGRPSSPSSPGGAWGRDDEEGR